MRTASLGGSMFWLRNRRTLAVAGGVDVDREGRQRFGGRRDGTGCRRSWHRIRCWARRTWLVLRAIPSWLLTWQDPRYRCFRHASFHDPSYRPSCHRVHWWPFSWRPWNPVRRQPKPTAEPPPEQMPRRRRGLRGAGRRLNRFTRGLFGTSREKHCHYRQSQQRTPTQQILSAHRSLLAVAMCDRAKDKDWRK